MTPLSNAAPPLAAAMDPSHLWLVVATVLVVLAVTRLPGIARMLREDDPEPGTDWHHRSTSAAEHGGSASAEAGPHGRPTGGSLSWR